MVNYGKSATSIQAQQGEMAGAHVALANNTPYPNLEFSSPQGTSITYQSGEVIETDMDITNAYNLDFMNTAFSLAWNPQVVQLVNSPTSPVEAQNWTSAQQKNAVNQMMAYSDNDASGDGGWVANGYSVLYVNINQSATAGQLDIAFGNLGGPVTFGTATTPADIMLWQLYFEVVGPGNPDIHLVEADNNAGPGYLIAVNDLNSVSSNQNNPTKMDFGMISPPLSGYVLNSSLNFTVVQPVTGITLSKSSDTITAGDTDQLTATVAPANASNQILNWASDNTAVATVDQTGLVTAVAAGTANITAAATDGSGITSAPCAVTVQAAVPVTSVTLSKTNYFLQASGTGMLTATTIPSNTSVTWSTSNSSIVSITSSGDTCTLTPESTTGTATITATLQNNDSASCTVTVASPTTTFVLKVNGNTISNAVNPTNASYGLTEETNNYSSYNGSDVYYTAEGYDLAEVLESADPNDFGNGVGSVVTAVVYGSDGYVWQDVDTAQQDLFANPNTLYYYPSSGGSAQPVDTIIAVDSAAGENNQSGLNTLDTLRLFMGQQISTQDTSQGLVKWVTEIDLYTTPW